MQVCLNCGKPFPQPKGIGRPAYRERKYCSHKCYYQYIPVLQLKRYIPCKSCKKLFLPRWKYAKYCSRTCYRFARSHNSETIRERTCATCNKVFKVKPWQRHTRKTYCSKKCQNQSTTKHWEMVPCENCSKLIRRTYNPTLKIYARFCSKPCFYEWQRNHPLDFSSGVGKPTVRCIKRCLVCGKKMSLLKSQVRREYCSKPCMRKRISSGAIWSKYHPACVQCGTTTVKHKGRGYCKECWKTSEWYRAKNSKKMAKRRGAEIKGDITPQFLRELWEATNMCAECGKVMENHSQYPYGRHLDHILPIALGGTHTKDNVRYIHAYCNVRRGLKNLPKNFGANLKEGTGISTAGGSFKNIIHTPLGTSTQGQPL